MSKLKKFKSRFKRFVLVLPVLFSFILSLCSTFFVFSADSVIVNRVQICDYFGLSLDSPYIYISDDYYSYLIYLDDISCDVSKESGIITVIFTPNAKVFRGRYDSLNKKYVYFDVSSSYNLAKFEYNSESNHICFYRFNLDDYDPVFELNDFLGVESDLFDLNGLDVDVSFSPPLRGDVSREFEYNGILQKYTSFNMTITNNSLKPIIYFMYIDTFDSSNPIVDNDGNWHNEFGHWSYPSDGVSFQFIKKEWVYSRNMDTQSSFSGTTADRWKKYYKPTFYHYLAAGDSLTQTFNWSQINIVANTNYYCLVGAQLTELDCGSDISNYDSDALNSEYKDFPITGFSPVYHSIFSLSDLSDIPYNPNDSSNGLIPNSDYRIEDSRYTMQFDASESMDGFLDYNSGDLYSDQNSWFNNKDVPSRPTVSGSGSFSFFSLIGGISNVYDFLRYSLSILPSEVYMIILSSIFIVIFIGIIKRLG